MRIEDQLGGVNKSIEKCEKKMEIWADKIQKADSDLKAAKEEKEKLSADRVAIFHQIKTSEILLEQNYLKTEIKR